MDGSSFDDLTKRLTNLHSRRTALGSLLAGVLAPLGAFAPLDGRAAKQKKREKQGCLANGRRCGKRRGRKPGQENFDRCARCCSSFAVKRKRSRRCAGRPDGTRCTNDRHCGSGLCRGGACRVAGDFAIVQAAVDAANEGGNVNIPPGYYVFAQTLSINKNLKLIAEGANTTTFDGDGGMQLIHIAAGKTVEIRGLTITDGLAQPDIRGGNGGGIHNEGTLTLDGVVVTGNGAAASGGGIYNLGTLVLSNFCHVTGNEADEQGAGIALVGGTLVLDDSTVTHNSAVTNGGGISTRDASTTITGQFSSVAHNTSILDGGGIHVWAGTLTLEAGTDVSRNKATGATADGGGVISFSGAAVTIEWDDIVVDNEPNNCASDTGGSIPNCIG